MVLSCALTSELTFGLEFSVSALADAVAKTLTDAAGKIGPLHFEYSAAAKFSAKVTLSQAVRLFAQCGPQPETVRFSVRKAQGRHFALGASLGLTVKFADVVAVLKEFDGIFGQVTGLPAKLVARLREEVNADAFNANEQKLFDEAVKRLKLADPKLKAWQSIKQALAKTQKTLKETIPQSIELGFKYTWDRLTERSAIAVFDVPYDRLAAVHTRILTLDLDALRQTPGIRFESYFGKVVDTFTLGYGFGLRAGDFVFADRTETRRRWITQTNLAGHEQKAFLGARSYTTQWLEGIFARFRREALPWLALRGVATGVGACFSAAFRAEMNSFTDLKPYRVNLQQLLILEGEGLFEPGDQLFVATQGERGIFCHDLSKPDVRPGAML